MGFRHTFLVVFSMHALKNQNIRYNNKRSNKAGYEKLDSVNVPTIFRIH